MNLRSVPSLVSSNFQSSRPDCRRYLWNAVSTVDDNIDTCCIGACIGRKVQIGTFQLMGLSFTTIQSRVALVPKTKAQIRAILQTYPIGVNPFQVALVSESTKLEISVLIYPGETLLTLAKSTHSTARLLPIKPSVLCSDFHNRNE